MRSVALRWTFAALAFMACAWTAASASAPPVTVSIVVSGIAFQQADASVVVGDTIEWINRDVVDHTATERKQAWDVLIPAGKSVRLVVKTAGTFDYYCRFHPNMTARLVVRPPKPSR